MFPESSIKMFRDMHKNPDLYVSDPSEKAEIDRMLDESNQKPKFIEKRMELQTSSGKIFSQTVDLVRSAELLPEFKDNINEEKVLAQRKEVTMNFLSNILADVNNYLTHISVAELNSKDSYDDIKKYQEAASSADSIRKSFHDKMIRNIKIASRLININFNLDYPEDLRLKEEMKLADRQGMSIDDVRNLAKQRQYYKFPITSGGFVDFNKMPKDPIGERLYLAEWAKKIYADLSVLDEVIHNSNK